MFAVVQLQGHQYIVAKDQELIVDRLELEEWKDLVIDTVLLVFDESGKTLQIGQPTVAKAKVVATVVSHQKWEKVKIVKFRRKNRYQRNIGFRQHQTTLKIKSVEVNG